MFPLDSTSSLRTFFTQQLYSLDLRLTTHKKMKENEVEIDDRKEAEKRGLDHDQNESVEFKKRRMSQMRRLLATTPKKMRKEVWQNIKMMINDTQREKSPNKLPEEKGRASCEKFFRRRFMYRRSAAFQKIGLIGSPTRVHDGSRPCKLW